MNLHCIGDSHACFFLGENRISKIYPTVETGLYKNIYCYRLGSPLAYNLIRTNSSVQAREKIFNIVKTLHSKQDVLLFSFGEVDCRAHLLKKAEELNQTYEQIVNSCVQNYLSFIREIKEMGFHIFIWNAVYSANYDASYDFEFPYYGTIENRNTITKVFNQTLKSYQQQTGYFFIDITDSLLNESTQHSVIEYFFDEIHLNNLLFMRVVKIIRQQIPQFRPEVKFKKIIPILICLLNSK